MPSPVVTDGRIDIDKLRELLATGGEFQELDFKRGLDLSETKHGLDFVKDALAMSNLPTGGYIVVGVTGAGEVASDSAPIVGAQWDSADLGARINAYTEAPVRVVSAVHEHEGWSIALVFVHPNVDRLPVPVSKLGQYREAGRERQVLRPGEIWIRRGTSNRPMTYADWPQLLQAHDAQLRLEARASAQDLIADVVAAIRESAAGEDGGSARPQPSIPLVLGLGRSEFDDALQSALEQPNFTRIARFLRQAGGRAIDRSAGAADREAALDDIAAVAIAAAELEREDVFELSTSALVRAYHAPPGVPDAIRLSGARDRDTTQFWVDIILRVFAIGSFLVREHQWRMLRQLVNQQFSGDPAYPYATWIRHASVQAARANLFADGDTRRSGGRILSRAWEFLAERPRLRPDETATLAEGETTVLNSLIQFDLVAFLLVQAGVTVGRAGYYPAAAAFDDWRGMPVLDLIVTDDVARRALFGERSDEDVSTAIELVLEQLENEAWNAGGLWRGSPGSADVARFLAKFPPRPSGSSEAASLQ